MKTLITFLLLTLAACAAPTLSSQPAPSPSRPSVVVSDPFIVAAQYLANGEFNLPDANALGRPGFHEAFSATHTLLAKLDPTKGKALIISLRDASRPQQKCESDISQSGCATVDWSDDPSRPKVPSGGVFDNSISLQLASGNHTFYLSESGALAETQDKIAPGSRQSAVGGSAREWRAILSDDLVTGSAMRLNLVMTKLGAPSVRIAYEVRVQPTK